MKLEKNTIIKKDPSDWSLEEAAHARIDIINARNLRDLIEKISTSNKWLSLTLITVTAIIGFSSLFLQTGRYSFELFNKASYMKYDTKTGKAWLCSGQTKDCYSLDKELSDNQKTDIKKLIRD